MEDVSTNELPVAHDSTESRTNINQDGNGNSTAKLTMKDRFKKKTKAPISSKSDSMVPADELSSSSSSSSSRGVEISTTNSSSQILDVEPPKKIIPVLESNLQEATKVAALTQSKIPEKDLIQFLDDNDKSSASVLTSSSSSLVQTCESRSSVSSVDVDFKTKIAEKLNKRKEEDAQKTISSSVEAPIYTKNNKDSENVKTPISSFESITLPLNNVNQHQVKNSPSQLNLISTTLNILKQENSTATQLCTNPAPLNISTAKEITPKIPPRVNREKVEIVNADPILTSATSLYVPALVKTIADATIADLMGKQWNFFQYYAELELDQLVESKVVKQKDLERIKKFLEPLSVTMWEILFEKLVLPLEKKFEKSVCFWGKELDKILQDFSVDSLLQFLPRLPDFPQFPEPLFNILQAKINHFINETQRRNKQIQTLENRASDCIIQEAIKYFRQECEFRLECQYLDENQLGQLLEKNGNQTLKNFDSAMKLTSENPGPENDCSYDSSLYEKLERQLLSINNEISNKNQENKNNMEKCIKLEMENSIKSYRTKIHAYSQGQLKWRYYTLEKIKTEFYTIGKQVLQTFDDNNKKKRNGPPELVQRVRSELQSLMENEGTAKFGQIQRDEEEKVRKQMEEKEREKERERKRMEEREKEKEKERQQREQKEQEKERKQKEEKENKMRPAFENKRKANTQTQSEMNQNKSDTSNSASNFHNLHSGPPSVTTHTRDADGMKSLPTATLAFHIGLNKTKVGITDNQGRFLVLANVENVLYEENSRLVPHMDKTDTQAKYTTLKGLLLKNPVDKQYEIKVNGRTEFFRIETLFSFLLRPLKLKAELEFRKIFNKALIAVPQTFNTVQRQAVTDAAGLAGFELVDLMNDTTALAFKFMMTHPNTFHNGQKLLSITSFEGFIDAALFSVENGTLVCEKKFGDYFLFKRIGWVESFKDWCFGKNEPMSPKAIKSVVEEIVHGLEKDIHNTSCILACRAEDRCKFTFGSLGCIKKIEAVNNLCAVAGAADFVSIKNCQSPENSLYRQWFGMNGGKIGVYSLGNSLTDQGPFEYRPVKNPGQGQNLNSTHFHGLKKLEVLDRMKAEEEACLHLLKLASNVEKILFNSSHPAKDTVNSCYEKLRELKHVDLDEIYDWQDKINQILKSLQ